MNLTIRPTDHFTHSLRNYLCEYAVDVEREMDFDELHPVQQSEYMESFDVSSALHRAFTLGWKPAIRLNGGYIRADKREVYKPMLILPSMYRVTLNTFLTGGIDLRRTITDASKCHNLPCTFTKDDIDLDMPVVIDTGGLGHGVPEKFEVCDYNFIENDIGDVMFSNLEDTDFSVTLAMLSNSTRLELSGYGNRLRLVADDFPYWMAPIVAHEE